MSFQIVNFYRFVAIDEPAKLENYLRPLAAEKSLLGKIILSHEGINGALSGEREKLEEFLMELKKDERFADMELKWSVGETKPFRRLLFKIKPAIVTFMGSEDPSPDEINRAPRLSPETWDKLSAQEDVVLVDTRNDYECDWGSFERADLLPIKKFSDFGTKFVEKYAAQKDKTFLIFCTGGIRCEKAAPWLEKKGFSKVYQLDGGILKYLEEKSQNGTYRGSCFVFDQRWALSANLAETDEHAAERVLQEKPEVPSTAGK